MNNQLKAKPNQNEQKTPKKQKKTLMKLEKLKYWMTSDLILQPKIKY